MSLFLSVFLWPEEGDFPENLHCVVYVIINKHSLESFMCLDHTGCLFPAQFKGSDSVVAQSV